MAFVTSFSLSSIGRSHRVSFGNVTSRRPHHRAATRMIATEPMTDVSTKTELSDQALVLISYIRGHKTVFQPGEGFISTTTTLFKKNDTAHTFTPLDELETNKHVLPGGEVAAFMVSQKDDLMSTALQAAERIKSISSDDVLLDIFQYDMFALLRVISYAVASGSMDFLHENNVNIMKLLHEDVGIPPSVVPSALNAVKDFVLANISDSTVAKSTATCFDIVHEAFV